MQIWIIYVDGENYYSTFRWFDAKEMYDTLSKKLGADRVTWESKKI